MRGKRSRRAWIALMVAAGTLPRMAQAANQFWDINGASTGAGGTAPSGTWNSSNTNWNGNSAGTLTATTWTAGNTAVFSAGSDATGAFTVTLGTSQSAGGLTVEEGTLTLGGSATLTFASGAIVDVAPGLTTTI